MVSNILNQISYEVTAHDVVHTIASDIQSLLHRYIKEEEKALTKKDQKSWSDFIKAYQSYLEIGDKTDIKNLWIQNDNIRIEYAWQRYCGGGHYEPQHSIFLIPASLVESYEQGYDSEYLITDLSFYYSNLTLYVDSLKNKIEDEWHTYFENNSQKEKSCQEQVKNAEIEMLRTLRDKYPEL